MRVLVIAPHMDDEVLGCGGAIAKHAVAGDYVAVCIVANRAYNHIYDPKLIEREKRSCLRAREILGYNDVSFLDLPDERLDKAQIDIIVPLEKTVNDTVPDIVYLPHYGDLNQDHRAVCEAARVACRPNAQNYVRVLRVFEIPSSTDQIPTQSTWPFLPNYYADIAFVLQKKISAVKCYEVENKKYPHPRSPEGVDIYARKRGMEVGLEAAESFMTIREVW